MEQQQAQNSINAQMAKFQNAANYPNQQLSILQSALGMTPYEQGQQSASTTQTQQSADPLSAALSGVKAVGSLMPMFGMLRPAAQDRHHQGRHASVRHRHSCLSLQGRPEDLPESGRADGRGRGEAFRPGGGGEDSRLGRQDGGSPGDHGRAGGSPRAGDGSPDSGDVHGRAADARPQPGCYCRRKAPDGRNGPADRRCSMGGPRMPGPNLAAIASWGHGAACWAEADEGAPPADAATEGSLAVADPVNTGFDPLFGDPLAKFRAALAAQGISTNIFSGVRDSAKQQALYENRQAELAGQPLPHPEMGYVPRAAVPGTSLHERGLAADIRPSNPADLPKMYALARQYGIQPLGASDPYHFQLGNWQQAEATQAPQYAMGPDQSGERPIAVRHEHGGGRFAVPAGTASLGDARRCIHVADGPRREPRERQPQYPAGYPRREYRQGNPGGRLFPDHRPDLAAICASGRN